MIKSFLMTIHYFSLQTVPYNHLISQLQANHPVILIWAILSFVLSLTAKCVDSLQISSIRFRLFIAFLGLSTVNWFDDLPCINCAARILDVHVACIVVGTTTTEDPTSPLFPKGTVDPVLLYIHLSK